MDHIWAGSHGLALDLDKPRIMPISSLNDRKLVPNLQRQVICWHALKGRVQIDILVYVPRRGAVYNLRASDLSARQVGILLQSSCLINKIAYLHAICKRIGAGLLNFACDRYSWNLADFSFAVDGQRIQWLEPQIRS